MRFLVDNALSPLVARKLTEAGHDTIHLRDRDFQSASDEEIVELATNEDRVVISADTDFGTILALRQATKPSFILFRGDAERRPARQAEALREYIPQLEQVLLAGAIIVISASRLRIRTLPVRSR